MQSLSGLARYAASLGLFAAFLTVPGFSQTLSDQEKLGKAIFFDQNLSVNKNQACAACHAPESGWTGPIAAVNAHGAVYPGSIPGRFGNRKPPSSAYATQSPILHQTKAGLFVGGNFWDGRATGEKLGNPAADQAQGPFLNPAEQALPASACVVYRVCTAAYPVSFTSVWGASTCDIVWPADIATRCATEGAAITLSPEDQGKSNENYDKVALSIAAYEASAEVNAFTSKYDYSFTGYARLTTEERKGFSLFMGKARCFKCHPSGPKALFTDYTYDNLGVPKNLENPVYQRDPGFVDRGLGAYLEAVGYPEAVFAPELGKMKVPTLRNADRRPSPEFVKAFSHNGYFKSIEEIVHFYNTRDVYPVCAPGLIEKVNCWPPPEYAPTVNRTELGNLGLSAGEEASVAAFIKALSDGYRP